MKLSWNQQGSGILSGSDEDFCIVILHLAVVKLLLEKTPMDVGEGDIVGASLTRHSKTSFEVC